jgi:hypothetical protein
MKLFTLATAIGLGLAFSVGAQQTTTDEQQQQQSPKGKRVEQTTDQSAGPAAGHSNREKVKDTSQPNRIKAGANVSSKIAGGTVQSTTVFRNGQQTSESLSLHRSTRDRADVHFSIGTHPRDWWLRTYSIVLIDGCHYFQADNGCWYPAYGFDPSCNFQPGVVYCD